MKNLLIAGLLATTLAAPATAALKEGDAAPDFRASASLNGKTFTFSLNEALKKGPVVVYFYPSAYTGGCNLQAHTFAAKHEAFSKAGASIIGVSLDSIARLNEFSADPDFCGGKVAVASDSDGKIARSYDLNVREASAGRKDSRGQAIEHGFAERVTFVVSPSGRIVSTIGGVAPVTNVEQALEVVQKLAAAHASSGQR